MKKCPFCKEEIQEEAIKCRYCGEFLGSGPLKPQSQMVSAPPQKASAAHEYIHPEPPPPIYPPQFEGRSAHFAGLNAWLKVALVLAVVIAGLIVLSFFRMVVIIIMLGVCAVVVSAHLAIKSKGNVFSKPLFFVGVALAFVGYIAKSVDDDDEKRKKAIINNWLNIKAECLSDYSKGRYTKSIDCFNSLLEANPKAADTREIAQKRDDALKKREQIESRRQEKRNRAIKIIRGLAEDRARYKANGANQASAVIAPSPYGGGLISQGIIKSYSYSIDSVEWNDNSTRAEVFGTLTLTTSINERIVGPLNFICWEAPAGNWEIDDAK